MLQKESHFSLHWCKVLPIKAINYPVVVFITLTVDASCWDLIFAWNCRSYIMWVEVFPSQDVLEADFFTAFKFVCYEGFMERCLGFTYFLSGKTLAFFYRPHTVIIVVWLEPSYALLPASRSIFNIMWVNTSILIKRVKTQTENDFKRSKSLSLKCSTHLIILYKSGLILKNYQDLPEFPQVICVLHKH